jgi:hypothetical protein
MSLILLSTAVRTTNRVQSRRVVHPDCIQMTHRPVTRSWGCAGLGPILATSASAATHITCNTTLRPRASNSDSWHQSMPWSLYVQAAQCLLLGWSQLRFSVRRFLRLFRLNAVHIRSLKFNWTVHIRTWFIPHGRHIACPSKRTKNLS